MCPLYQSITILQLVEPKERRKLSHEEIRGDQQVISIGLWPTNSIETVSNISKLTVLVGAWDTVCIYLRRRTNTDTTSTIRATTHATSTIEIEGGVSITSNSVSAARTIRRVGITETSATDSAARASEGSNRYCVTCPSACGCWAGVSRTTYIGASG